jgi:large subunit ribosomal protein L22
VAAAATQTPERTEVRAEAKWVRISPRKARLVVEHIRGRSVPEARTVLAFTPRAAAREVEKVLRSAVANAEANHGLMGDELLVSAAYVDEGPTIKRWRARARGRVARIRKRTCHITVRLAPPEPSGLARDAAAASEKPKRAQRTRKTAEPQATEAKPKPKRTTTRKKKEATT